MRNRYLDMLRAVAIVRVIVYHFFGWPWLSIALPAMGVMFSLAGSLMAASLEKRSARKVVLSRLRRLLPPLWLLGVIAVPVMLWAGWAQEHGGENPFSIPRLLYWIFPLGTPPGSDKGIDAWEPLWYIRAYVWFILLSPFMYALYRKIGWFAIGIPIVLIGVIDKTGFSLPQDADDAMWDFVTFAGCWMVGFAHHDGRLQRARTGLLVFFSIVLGVLALYWLRGHQGDDAWDLNDVNESQALWSLGFVLLAMRWQPSMGWLARVPPLDKAVTLLNARAVTVYLWHNIAIDAVWPVLAFVSLDSVGHGLDQPVDFAGAVMITFVAVLLFGWVEDLAARRRPRLWPTSGPALRTAKIPQEHVTPALTADEPPAGTPLPPGAESGLGGLSDPVPPGRRRGSVPWPPDGVHTPPKAADPNFGWTAALPRIDTSRRAALSSRDEGAGPEGAGPEGAGPEGAGPEGAGPEGAGPHAADKYELGGTLDLGLPVAGRPFGDLPGPIAADGIRHQRPPLPRAEEAVEEAAEEAPEWFAGRRALPGPATE